jgi:hypothetical protein
LFALIPCLYPHYFLTLQFELCDNIESNLTQTHARNGERVWEYGMIVGWTWTKGLGIMIFNIPNHLQVKYKYNNLKNESFMSPIVTPYVKHWMNKFYW